MPISRDGNAGMQVIPTTGLNKIFSETEARIGLLRKSSSWIQIDVCDGIFTTGKTFELELINKIETATDDVLWDIHLMVKEPEKWLEKCFFIGASRIIGQVEMMSNRESFIKKIKDEGLEAGVAFDVDTEITNIPDESDMVLLMGRKAGFKPEEFNNNVLKKIEKVKGMGFRVGVDGGIDIKNIEIIKNAGADIIYSGFNYWDLKEKYGN